MAIDIGDTTGLTAEQIADLTAQATENAKNEAAQVQSNLTESLNKSYRECDTTLFSTALRSEIKIINDQKAKIETLIGDIDWENYTDTTKINSIKAEIAELDRLADDLSQKQSARQSVLEQANALDNNNKALVDSDGNNKYAPTSASYLESIKNTLNNDPSLENAQILLAKFQILTQAQQLDHANQEALIDDNYKNSSASYLESIVEKLANNAPLDEVKQLLNEFIDLSGGNAVQDVTWGYGFVSTMRAKQAISTLVFKAQNATENSKIALWKTEGEVELRNARRKEITGQFGEADKRDEMLRQKVKMDQQQRLDLAKEEALADRNDENDKTKPTHEE
jgi:hypothetical protein